MRFIALPRVAGASFEGCVLHVHDTLEAVRARWQEVLAHGAGYVFQTWEWNWTWQQTVGQAQGVRPRIVELRDASGVTLALWPLGIYRRHGLRVLDFLGEVMSDYRAPVLRTGFPGALPAGAFAALWTAIACGVDGVDLVQMRRMPRVLEPPPGPVRNAAADAPAAGPHAAACSGTPPEGPRNPMTDLPGAIQTEHAYAARLPRSMDVFDQRFSARRLSDMRRRLRQLGELGQLRIEPRHPPAERPAVIRAMAPRWRAERLASGPARLVIPWQPDMVFASLEFLTLFLPAFLAVYALTPARARAISC